MAVKKYRYIGVYGRKGRPAWVGHVGLLFHGDEVFHDEEECVLKFVRPNMPPVPATPEALAMLAGGDFSAELTCEHRFASGECCPNKPAEESTLCKFHLTLKIKAAKRAEKPLPPTEPAPRDLITEFVDSLQSPTGVAENSDKTDNTP